MPCILSAAAAASLLLGCTPKQPVAQEPAAAPAVENLATTRQVMLGLTIPASDVLFQVGNKPPTDDAEWDRVAANAVMLAESGNMLLTGARDLKQPEWTQHASDLVARSRVAMDAAARHDVDAVLEAGNGIYEVCDACHARYMPARAGEQGAPAAAP